MPLPDQEHLVSIIVPVFNQKHYVGKCLESIRRQSYRNLEIIVVNDGSTDNSLDVIIGQQKKDQRIKLINKENEGVSFARRDGLNIANGAYVMFVDSDDLLPRHAVRELLKDLQAHDADVAVGAMERKYWCYKRKQSHLSATDLETTIGQPELFQKYYISFFGVNILPVNMWGKLYKRECIERASQQTQLFSQTIRHMGEDEFFSCALFPYINRLYVSGKTVYTYRYGGITSGYNPHIRELYDFSDHRIWLLDQYHYSKGYAPLFTEYKNILLTELTQLIVYQKWDKEKAEGYLRHEVENRRLAKRMHEYYNDRPVPAYMRQLIDKEYDKIYETVVDNIQKRRKYFLIKKAVARVSALLSR